MESNFHFKNKLVAEAALTPILSKGLIFLDVDSLILTCFQP